MKLHRVAKLFPEMSTEQFNDLVADIKKNGQIEPILTYSGKIADGHHRFKACRKLGIETKTVEWKDVRPSEDASLVTYVISRNLRRRHLTQGQRAAIATKALPLYKREAEAKLKRASAEGGKASGETRREQAKATKGPAILRDPSIPEVPETKEESEAPPPQKAKKAPKDREQESTAKAAKHAGVSRRYVQEAAAIEKKSPALHKLIEDGKITIPLAKRIVELDPPHIKLVLKDGKHVGYKKALDDFLAQYRPGAESAPTDRDLSNKLRQATRQAEALNKTLEGAVEMAKQLKIERGPGLVKLSELTELATTLVQRITS